MRDALATSIDDLDGTVSDDVKIAVKDGFDFIELDGMQGSTGAGSAEVIDEAGAAAGRLRLRRRPARRRELEASLRQAQGPTRESRDLQGKLERSHPRHIRVRTGVDRIA